MIELVQQLAVLDVLLGNWDGVLVRMGAPDRLRDEALAVVAARLAAARSPEEIDLVLDDLLDIVQDTPAYEYVRDLIARARIAPELMTRTRGLADASAFTKEDEALLGDSSGMAGRSLGRMIGSGHEPYLVNVYFATNRKRLEHGAELFSGEADLTGFSCGLAEVTIPVGVHRKGRLEQRPWWQPLHDKDDPRRYVVLGRVDQLTKDLFISRLASDKGSCDELLVFMHGYNVTFEDAARRAAQFAYDLQFRGRVLLYSWPSLGSFAGYMADEERAFLSSPQFAEFVGMLNEGPWTKVHLLAHSMGNRVMLYGLSGGAWPSGKLDQVVFVAADVYVDTFSQLFAKISGKGRFTSYASRRDRALLLSNILHKAERIGHCKDEPMVLPGLETVDATKVDTGLLGHGYFADKASVISDIAELLDQGRRAAERKLIYQPLTKQYWDFRDLEEIGRSAGVDG